MATILVVEDDPTIQTLLAAQLQPQYEVKTVRDRQAALAALYQGTS